MSDKVKVVPIRPGVTIDGTGASDDGEFTCSQCERTYEVKYRAEPLVVIPAGTVVVNVLPLVDQCWHCFGHDMATGMAMIAEAVRPKARSLCPHTS